MPQNMLALAIMLLKISSGVPIESMRQEGDLGPDRQPSEGADLVAAHRWLTARVEGGRLSLQFADAIKHCLQCYLDPLASFNNPEFAKAVEDRVLKPLEREMQFFHGDI